MTGALRRIKRQIMLTLTVGVAIWLAAGLLCLRVPPYEFWPAGFVAFSLPAPLFLNFLFLLYWLLHRSWNTILPLAMLVFGWSYYARLFAINANGDAPEGAKTLQVLSYNVHVFNAYADHDGSEQEGSTEMVDWVATHPADVYCLQEFYSNRGSSTFNTVSKIGTRYDKHRYFSVSHVDGNKADIGIAIFSRYPIVNNGVIRFGESNHNRAIFADLKMGSDTVRIYSAHLQSMSIKSEDIENTYSAIGNKEVMTREGRNLARRLRKGFIDRARQVEVLQEHYRQSPHPYIVCGDLNDIPFSYTYNLLAQDMDNAFVKAGSGVGATYNGPIPFLRIDNQFYSKGLRAYQFQTHHDVARSDHYPISAKYVIEKE